jgi:hypothetical protein
VEQHFKFVCHHCLQGSEKQRKNRMFRVLESLAPYSTVV